MEEQSEVAHLVGQLVAEHRDAGGEPGRQADGEGRTNCDTVGLRRLGELGVSKHLIITITIF